MSTPANATSDNVTDTAADEAAVSGVSEPTRPAMGFPHAHGVTAQDAEHTLTENAPEARQASILGEQPAEVAPEPSEPETAPELTPMLTPQLAAFTAQSEVVRSHRINTRRETEWVDLTETFGEHYRLPSGEAWKLLMITDIRGREWDHWQSCAGDIVATYDIASRFILMHNGWTDEHGDLYPQPGDLCEMQTSSAVYVAATDPASDGAIVPYTDRDGEQLYRRIGTDKKAQVSAAFWEFLPRKIAVWCMNEAYRRSTTLPNLTKTPSPNMSASPNRNGTT